MVTDFRLKNRLEWNRSGDWETGVDIAQGKTRGDCDLNSGGSGAG